VSVTIKLTLTETEIQKLDRLSHRYARGDRDQFLSRVIRVMEHERRVASVRETRKLILEELNGRTLSEDECVELTKR
jgi:hypothetical protein